MSERLQFAAIFCKKQATELPCLPTINFGKLTVSRRIILIVERQFAACGKVKSEKLKMQFQI